jgi:hypothetical protein
MSVVSGGGAPVATWNFYRSFFLGISIGYRRRGHRNVTNVSIERHIYTSKPVLNQFQILNTPKIEQRKLRNTVNTVKSVLILRLLLNLLADDVFRAVCMLAS